MKKRPNGVGAAGAFVSINFVGLRFVLVIVKVDREVCRNGNPRPARYAVLGGAEKSAADALINAWARQR